MLNIVNESIGSNFHTHPLATAKNRKRKMCVSLADRESPQNKHVALLKYLYMKILTENGEYPEI